MTKEQVAEAMKLKLISLYAVLLGMAGCQSTTQPESVRADKLAKDTGQHLTVVDEQELFIIGEVNAPEMDEADDREALVLEIVEAQKVEELAQNDYEKVQGNFIAQANELVLVDEDIAELRKKGLNNMADRIERLRKASLAYDWARENL